jgi:chromosomal replication initiation ATPase DnaA
MRILRDMDMSLEAIGAALGGRDHSTVIEGLRRVDRDPDMRARAAEIAAEEGWA